MLDDEYMHVHQRWITYIQNMHDEGLHAKGKVHARCRDYMHGIRLRCASTVLQKLHAIRISYCGACSIQRQHGRDYFQSWNVKVIEN